MKNEVEIHSRLKHPSVLELYNFFEDKNYVYLVLEVCHNGALNRFLKTTKLKEAEGEVHVSAGLLLAFAATAVVLPTKGHALE